MFRALNILSLAEFDIFSFSIILMATDIMIACLPECTFVATVVTTEEVDVVFPELVEELARFLVVETNFDGFEVVGLWPVDVLVLVAVVLEVW